jgi:hypothetical protein
MFPGSIFTSDFWKEYHSLNPKHEPVEEYEDRIKLYRAWHELNHAVSFFLFLLLALFAWVVRENSGNNQFLIFFGSMVIKNMIFRF